MNGFPSQAIAANQRIQVKFLGTYSNRGWLRQFPNNRPIWGNCEYSFDLEAHDYDWLVVYNDLPQRAPGGNSELPTAADLVGHNGAFFD